MLVKMLRAGLSIMAVAAFSLTLAATFIGLAGPASGVRGKGTPAAAFCSDGEIACSVTAGVAQPQHMTTAYAVAFAARFLDARASVRMLHRVETPTQVSSAPFTTTEKDYSGNWSGYWSDLSSTSYRVSAVQGYFNLAAVCSQCFALGTWVGIGGEHSGAPLIQTGVNQQSLYGFIELLPAVPSYYYLAAASGDQMYADVTFDYDTHLWYVLIEDLRSGYYVASEYSYTTDQTAADWIEEALNPGQGIPGVGTVSWTHAYWTATSSYTTARPINSSLVRIVHQVFLRSSFNGSCLVPSGLASGGEGFSISRANSC